MRTPTRKELRELIDFLEAKVSDCCHKEEEHLDIGWKNFYQGKAQGFGAAAAYLKDLVGEE